MGEVVMCSEGEVEIMEVEKKGGSTSMGKWENFLPKMGLRILLVEDDDSTRQIIGALLRKCNYKVAAVADGLKAWEVLKARPHNIDLILTEADLPSVSGYALLTLIMEHEVCKNIPVIMMSTHDSISMVYNCMLRGAADFLVKPIRINELKNLWQHVWRRQSQLSRGGLGPQDESVGQEKLEATAENNATSDNSSSSKTRAPRQELCTKKGSDAQSSCGKLDMVTESAYMSEVEACSQSKQRISPVSLQEQGNFGNSRHNLLTPDSVAAGSDTAACNINNAIAQEHNAERQIHEVNVNVCTEANDNRDALPSYAREAIDLIGALDSRSRHHHMCSNDEGNRFEPSQQLDLTLRRFLPAVLENKTSNENQTLNHSNASPFTRYVNKASHPSNWNPTSISAPKDYNANSDDLNNKIISFPTDLTKEVEDEYRNASQKLFPVPLPVRGVRVEVCTPLTSPSPTSANQQINSYHQLNIDMMNSRHHYHHLDQSPKISSNLQKMEFLEERAHFSSADHQSASSSLQNDTSGAGYLNGGGSEEGNDQSHDLKRQRSLQREAALNKFRLKRKERCYEKKVRYESRKKLAEQRPRVKGQFVRQVPPDPPPQKSDHSGGSSVAN